MKTYETIMVPEQRLKTRTCDLCGVRATNNDWDAGTFNENTTDVRVEVRHRQGVCYPEDGWGTEIEVDIWYAPLAGG